MMKYVNEQIVFQEIPDEISLAINISGCPCRCPGCHSKYLWNDTGDVLTHKHLDNMIEKYNGEMTCILFMGGDACVDSLNDMANYLRNIHPQLKIAWYSGRTVISPKLMKELFNYIKIGPYISHLGPLNKPTTNQRLYKRIGFDQWKDITHLFWKS